MTGKVLVACDGLSALWQAQSRNLADSNTAHCDLIGAIWTLRKELLIQLTFKHMKIHQDSGIPMVLTRLASMNVEMDSIAKWTIDKEVVGPIAKVQTYQRTMLLLHRRTKTDVPSGS